MPLALHAQALVAFQRLRGELGLVGTERLQRLRAECTERLEGNAVLAQFLADPGRLRGGHDIAAARRIDDHAGADVVAQGQVPDLRSVLVVARHQRAGDRRGRAGVLVATEVDLAHMLAGLVVQRYRLPGEVGAIGGSGVGLPLRAVPSGLFQRRDNRVAHDLHALRIRLPRMGFDQHAEAIAQQEIAVREAWRRHRILEARGRIIVDHERRVVGQRQRTVALQIGDHAIAQHFAVAGQACIAGMQRFDLDRDVMLELGAVGGVQIDVEQRVPLLHQAQHGLHLRRVGLDVVAVEIEVLRGHAPAHFARATLVGAVPGAEALMAIDVEDRHEQPHHLVQRAARALAFE